MIITKLNEGKMLKAIFFIFLISATALTAYDGVIHLHIDNFEKSYAAYENNNLSKKFFKGKSYSTFLGSKIFLRLREELKGINKANNLFTTEYLKKYPEKPFDLYLFDIQLLKFMVYIQLEEPQLLSIANIDISKLEFSEYKNSKIYKKEGVYLSFFNKGLLVSNDLKYIKSYINDKNGFVTVKKIENGFENYLYINMDKVNSTPYLKSYWFTKDKDSLKNYSSSTIFFNITPKELNEKGVIELKNSVELGDIGKRLNINSSIKLLSGIKGFSVKPFPKNSAIKFYQRFIDFDKNSKIVLGSFNGDVKNIKELLLKNNPDGVFEDKDGYTTFKYGLMNREAIIYKIEGNYIVVSNDSKKLSKLNFIKNDLIEEVVITKDGLSQFPKVLNKLEKFSSNYTFKSYLNNFLRLYFNNIKKFSYNMVLKDKKMEYSTKILF